jgi:hypothetical protein
MRFPLAPVLLVLALAGCDRLIPKRCDAVGAISGVAFDLTAFAPTGTPTVVACLRGRCKPVTPGIVDTVEDQTLSAADPVPVTLTVDGVPRGSATVQLHKNQPNGPQCPPTAYFGTVRATAGGQLATS